jgi:hypothetical protein
MTGLTRLLSLTALLLLLAAAASGGDDRQPGYLTPDGKLAEALEVKDLQGGFAGFVGPRWVVEPSGKWMRAKLVAGKATAEQGGELSKEQLAALAKALARYELRDLPDEGKPGVNPHVVTVRFGKKEVSLALKAGEALPKVDPDKPLASVAARYAGIVAAVTDLLRDNQGKEKP